VFSLKLIHKVVYLSGSALFVEKVGVYKQTVEIQQLTRGSGLNCPPISKMFKPMQVGFAKMYRFSKNGE
jgi:hypothetical protein